MADRDFRLVIGTTNSHKGKELAELLCIHGLEVQTLRDFPDVCEVVEDGKSFADNARLKATGHARHLGCWILADDSGLEVDALGGAPGIYSARYAGEHATDEENNQHLLSELGLTPWEKRAANYHCHVALASPDGTIRAESFGGCRGRIRFEPVGENGFGYDPLFEILEYHQTFGELGPTVKATLSHRARALRAMVPQLVAIAKSCEAQQIRDTE